ncbi:MAG: ArnT family glycosyltransferase [Candidatus Omnitrophota bacterium]
MPKSQTHTFKDLLFLFFLSGFFLLFNLGEGSLASWDEAIYASVAKEIVQSGDWFHLTLAGQPWADKPPLCLWMTAFFYHLFGINEFSARLFSALSGVGTVFITYLLGTKLFGRWTGFLGALALLSSSHYFRFARFGMMDAPLVFFLSLALYFFWLGQERNRYLIFSGVAIGLAVMAKGFAAFLIFPVIWLYCWWAGEGAVLMRSSYWIGVMIAAAIALPWNMYEMVANREAFMRDVVTKHLFQRTLSAVEGHAGNTYFYIRTLINKYHPWILVGIASGPFFLWKAVRSRQAEYIFLTVWMFFMLAVVTLVQTKLPWYLLPVYPALSLTVGYFLAKLLKESQWVFTALLFTVIMGLHVPYSHIFDHDYSRDIRAIAPAVKNHDRGHGDIYLYVYHESPAAAFYLGKRALYLDDPESFVAAARSVKDFSCLIHEKNLKPFEPKLSALGLFVAGSAGDLRFLLKK